MGSGDVKCMQVGNEGLQLLFNTTDDGAGGNGDNTCHCCAYFMVMSNLRSSLFSLRTFNCHVDVDRKIHELSEIREPHPTDVETDKPFCC